MATVGNAIVDAYEIVENYGELLRFLGRNSLTETEVSQIKRIQSLYSLHILQGDSAALPDKLTLGDAKTVRWFWKRVQGKEGISKENFNLNTEKSKIRGTGALRSYAEDIVQLICLFQQRKGSEGYVNDPQNMFLEELKHWAQENLCFYPLERDSLKLIEKRAKYLEAVISDDILFPKAKIHSLCMDLLQILKYSIVADINNALAIISAKEQLAELRKKLKFLVQQCTYFIFHIFRRSTNSKVHMATMYELVNGEDPVYQNTSAKLLHMLCRSEPFMVLFPDENKQLKLNIKDQIQEGEIVEKEPEMEKSTFFTFDGKLCIPPQFTPPMPSNSEQKKRYLENMVVDDEGNVVMNRDLLGLLFNDEETSQKCGLEKYFQGNVFVAEQFLRAHGILQQIAKLNLVFYKAEVCAASMGDLLVYGFANKQLNVLLDTHDQLLAKMQFYVNALLRIAELRYKELAKDEKVDPLRNFWIPHFRCCYYYYHEIDKIAKDCCECVNIMRAKANSLTLEERFQKVQTATQDFLQAADGFTFHLNGVMGIPYTNVMKQNIWVAASMSNSNQLEGIGSELVRVPNPQIKYSPERQKQLAIMDKQPEAFIIPSASSPQPQKVVSTGIRRTSGSHVNSAPLSGAQSPVRRSQDRDAVSPVRKSQDMSYGKGKNEITDSRGERSERGWASDYNRAIFQGLAPIISLPEIESRARIGDLDFSYRHMTEQDLPRLKSRLVSSFQEWPDAKFALFLHGNNLNDSGVEHLMNFLSSPNSNLVERIVELNLSSNEFGDLGCRGLNKFLCDPRCKLRRLELSSCALTDASVMPLISALKTNATLVHLIMQDNFFTDNLLQTLTSVLLNGQALQLSEIAVDQTELNKPTYYTKQGVTIVNLVLSQRENLCWKLHNEMAPTKDPDDTPALEAFGQETRRRTKLYLQKLIALDEKYESNTTTLKVFKDLIHVCQVFMRTKGTDGILRSDLTTSFQYHAYGVHCPTSWAHYLDSAEHFGILVSVAGQNDCYELAPEAKSWEAPLPAHIAHFQNEDLSDDWRELMTALVLSLSEPKSREKLIQKIGQWGPFMRTSEEHLTNLVDLAIFRGILLNDGKYIMINDTSKIPVDFTKFPGYYLPVFAPKGSKKLKAPKEKDLSSRKHDSISSSRDKSDKSSDKMSSPGSSSRHVPRLPTSKKKRSERSGSLSDSDSGSISDSEGSSSSSKKSKLKFGKPKVHFRNNK